MLWSIFTYIITHHRLGGFSGLINGLIEAAIGALSMLTSEPTAKKQCKEDTYVCPLTLATLQTLHAIGVGVSRFDSHCIAYV